MYFKCSDFLTLIFVYFIDIHVILNDKRGGNFLVTSPFLQYPGQEPNLHLRFRDFCSN